jgi:hypothetical protein
MICMPDLLLSEMMFNVYCCRYQVHVWRTTYPADDSFTFPELGLGHFGIPALQEKPNFAICCPGGSMRACCAMLGFLRGLHQMDVISKARYYNGGASSCSPYHVINRSHVRMCHVNVDMCSNISVALCTFSISKVC